ncbi:helix-turn-helix domain-containing protein [Parapedobacter sp.]|uniref:helix-turn-helix domain-containing protein n=1 Tax=Parapedobacter sp. TaxID=1958893 RepID=UPI0039C9AF2B
MLRAFCPYFWLEFFLNTTNCPHRQLRLSRHQSLASCSLLQFSDLKIKEIAFKLGYYDAFHFSKSFVHEMGISPREYRTRYK